MNRRARSLRDHGRKQNIREPKPCHVFNPTRIQHTIQMIAFMLHDSRVKTIYLTLEIDAVCVAASIDQALKARHFAAQARHGQATFPNPLTFRHQSE